jgi:fructose-specific phosphotransferase system IIB component
MTKQKVVAVTACPTGVAHTFMAANKIIAWAKAHNIEVKVETQGSDGVKNRLTKQDIASATAIILATDVPIQDAERFDHSSPSDTNTRADQAYRSLSASGAGNGKNAPRWQMKTKTISAFGLPDIYWPYHGGHQLYAAGRGHGWADDGNGQNYRPVY